MIKIVFECDRCGAEIPGEIGYLDWGHTDRVNRERTDGNAFGEKHFCENCMEEIGAFIAGNRIKVPGQEEPPKEAAQAAEKEAEAVAAQAADAAEPDQQTRKRGKEIDVDWDKAEALYRAGWPCKKIMTEKEFSKLTEKQIYQRMYYRGLVAERANAAAEQQAKEQEVSA